MQQQRKDFLKLVPSNKESALSGGTSDVLPNERKKASFEVQDLIHYLNGGVEDTKKRKFLEGALNKDLHRKYNYTRSELLKDHVKEFVTIHKKWKNYKPTRKDIAIMAEISVGYGGLNNSHSIFMLTIIGQGTPEQHQFWVPKILNFEVTGTYAQTELGKLFRLMNSSLLNAGYI